jgi:hypothetical protein
VFVPKLDTLPAIQRLFWNELRSTPPGFVLYGCTAMALRLGHRQSLDFDFFSNEPFEPSQLLSDVAFLKNARVDQRGDNTLSVVVMRNGPVRLSFFGDVHMNRIDDPYVCPDNELQIASLLDLAATKLKSIQHRAEAKDYRDIASALLAGIRLDVALGAARSIYGTTFNAMAALKALTYFGDGNLQELPTDVQHALRSAAHSVGLENLPTLTAKPGITRAGH